MKPTRRRLLQLSAAMLAAESFPATIARALAIPANARTGTINDVEHVVVLMQENRSFDHYFGAFPGVRGFGDPRPISLPGGAPVWRQPDGRGGYVAPFRLDAKRTSAEDISSLDHSWKGSHARWKYHDAWIAEKTAMTMGHFTREDLPFYYALADAFTICDAYHCSIFGPTTPNRLFLFTGTSGLAVGADGPLAVRNPRLDLNFTADMHNDSPLFRGFNWTTYAERLEAAGVRWKVYQEHDNYGDNPLAYFSKFRGARAAAALRERGRAWVRGVDSHNAKASRGEHLVAAFAEDVRTGQLPAVSWIVAPYIMCEHPSAGPSYGQSLTARLLAAIVANPEIWAKTVFILNYDENDGFFDHVPPNLPATGAALGASTVDLAGENYRGEPVGLGPRVPMLVVSPWSKGGWVNSQLFDHTSVLQFLERRFGVAEPNITPWRRAVCGDLTSTFDFSAPPAAAPTLPDTSNFIANADVTSTLPRPTVPSSFAPAVQEPGQKRARPLPYDLQADCQLDVTRKAITLAIANTGAAGAALNVYSADGAGPWFFTVEAHKSLRHQLTIGGDQYAFSIYGPNGFLRTCCGNFRADAPQIDAAATFDRARTALRVTLHNTGPAPAALVVRATAYVVAPDREVQLAPGQSINTLWPLAPNAPWYDVVVMCAHDPSFQRRFAGHMETGAPSVTDPLIGRERALATPA